MQATEGRAEATIKGRAEVGTEEMATEATKGSTVERTEEGAQWRMAVHGQVATAWQVACPPAVGS